MKLNDLWLASPVQFHKSQRNSSRFMHFLRAPQEAVGKPRRGVHSRARDPEPPWTSRRDVPTRAGRWECRCTEALLKAAAFGSVMNGTDLSGFSVFLCRGGAQR
jgi:hypothetical protein